MAHRWATQTESRLDNLTVSLSGMVVVILLVVLLILVID